MERYALNIALQAVTGVAIVYFILGGHGWSTAVWAVLAVFLVWLTIMEMGRAGKLISEKSYWSWSRQIELIMIIVLLVSPLWSGSWFSFLIGIILGVFCLSDKAMRSSGHRRY